MCNELRTESPAQARYRQQRRRRALGIRLARYGILVGFLLLWEVLARVGAIDFFPCSFLVYSPFLSNFFVGDFPIRQRPEGFDELWRLCGEGFLERRALRRAFGVWWFLRGVEGEGVFVGHVWHALPRNLTAARLLFQPARVLDFLPVSAVYFFGDFAVPCDAVPLFVVDGQDVHQSKGTVISAPFSNSWSVTLAR